MDAVVPWQALIDLIEPHFPKTASKVGRPPYPLATMLRIDLMQQWYSLRRLLKKPGACRRMEQRH